MQLRASGPEAPCQTYGLGGPGSEAGRRHMLLSGDRTEGEQVSTGRRMDFECGWVMVGCCCCCGGSGIVCLCTKSAVRFSPRAGATWDKTDNEALGSGRVLSRLSSGPWGQTHTDTHTDTHSHISTRLCNMTSGFVTWEYAQALQLQKPAWQNRPSEYLKSVWHEQIRTAGCQISLIFPLSPGHQDRPLRTCVDAWLKKWLGIRAAMGWILTEGLR